MGRAKKTWQDVDYDLGEIYFRMAGGEGICNLAKEFHTQQNMLRRFVRDWAEATGHPVLPDKVLSHTIEDPRLVDQGKAMALWRAGWPVLEIAVDCHCTEECIKQIVEARINARRRKQSD